MTTATIDSIAAGLAALLAMTGATTLIGAPLTAALIAGLKAIADHAAGKTDAPTMMVSITGLDGAVTADNTAADTALDAKFPAPTTKAP